MHRMDNAGLFELATFSSAFDSSDLRRNGQFAAYGSCVACASSGCPIIFPTNYSFTVSTTYIWVT